MTATQQKPENTSVPLHAGRRLPVLKRLSGKLLRLTLLFGLLAEVMIFVPIIADMRIRWLSDRLNTVAAASVVLAASDSENVPQSVQNDVLLATGTKAIVLREKGASRLLAVSEMPSKVDKHIDITVTDPVTMIRDAFDTPDQWRASRLSAFMVRSEIPARSSNSLPPTPRCGMRCCAMPGMSH